MKFFQTNINSAVPNVIVEEEISDDLDRRWGKESAFIRYHCKSALTAFSVLIRDNSGTGTKKLRQNFLEEDTKENITCETF